MHMVKPFRAWFSRSPAMRGREEREIGLFLLLQGTPSEYLECAEEDCNLESEGLAIRN